MFHGFSRHRHRPAMFERGALKFVILNLIDAKPRHGYDIIQELEESSGGCYSPSPGTIYPTLQMLEDVGHVRVQHSNGKKVYEITDEGRAYLETHKDKVKHHHERMAECFGPGGSREFGEMIHEMKGIAEMVMHRGRGGAINAEQAKAITEILAKARKEIEEIVTG